MTDYESLTDADVFAAPEDIGGLAFSEFAVRSAVEGFVSECDEEHLWIAEKWFPVFFNDDQRGGLS